MKLIKTLFVCLFLFGLSNTTNAQFWKKLKKKVQDKVEQRVEKEVDKETDKAIDDVLNGKKREEEIKNNQSAEIPKFSGGSGILKLYNFGYEYVTEDVTISVYGNFDENNLSKSVKTYNEDRIIHPVDAYPKGYALAFNKGGFLHTKAAQIIIHHADAKKVVFSLKGTWNSGNEKKPVAASFVSLDITNIIDKKSKVNSSEQKNNTNKSTKNRDNSFNDINVSDAEIKIPNTFSFTSSLEIQMTSNEGDITNMEYLLGSYKDIYGMVISSTEMGENGKVFNVITPKNITMFMNIGGMKMKKTVAQDQFSQADFSDKVPTNPNDLQKTGATKSILGFTCHEYKHTNNEGFVSVWATKNFPFGKKNISMLGMVEDSIIDGFVLEIDMKSSSDKINMKAVKFNQNKNTTINTTEYKSMGF